MALKKAYLLQFWHVPTLNRPGNGPTLSYSVLQGCLKWPKPAILKMQLGFVLRSFSVSDRLFTEKDQTELFRVLTACEKEEYVRWKQETGE